MKKCIKNEEGQVLILFALLLAVLTGFAALAIDVGSMTLTKTKLQTAADAAALAGANELPNDSTAEYTAVEYAKRNGVQESDVTATAGHDGDPNKIKVVCKKKVSHTFARIIGFTDTDISASAVAKNNPSWQGEALPFMNFGFDYSTTDPNLRKMVAPGLKGTISDFYVRNSGEPNVYYEVDYADGITSENGFGNPTGLNGIKLREDFNKKVPFFKESDYGTRHVYIFSLRDSIVRNVNAGGTFMANNGNPMTLKQFSQGTGKTIDAWQLVLIECIFDDIKESNYTDIELTYTGNVFDLGNNLDNEGNPWEDDDGNVLPDLPDFPTNYLTSDGGSASLVE